VKPETASGRDALHSHIDNFRVIPPFALDSKPRRDTMRKRWLTPTFAPTTELAPSRQPSARPQEFIAEDQPMKAPAAFSLGLLALALLNTVLPGRADQERKPPADRLQQEPNTWVKRSPLKDGPISPGMGYECSLVYDPQARRVIRWAGHNQGGGGEQNAETWTYDPATAKWELKEPNTSPPGVCCAQQNVFDPAGGRFLRFAGFSGNHGWPW
jgi:hypothetical protein